MGNSLSCGNANHHSGAYCVGATLEVGSYIPNAWGLYDMHGNVWEYCLDTYAGYSSGAVMDPYVTGGYNRVIRGGSWLDGAGTCRSSNRGQYDPNGVSHHVGFRVVLAPVGFCPSDPVITVCASSQTVTAGSNCQATVPDFTAGVVASGTCPGALSITQSPSAGTLVGVSQQPLPITLTVTDPSGNTTACVASLTVQQGTCPVPAGFVAIAPGTFSMGESGVAEPVHSVTISYWYGMGAKEVTQAEYLALMGANPSHFQGTTRPVEQVTWSEARAYCAALTFQHSNLGTLPSGYEFRLPTEAEWEYACRAGTSSSWNVGPSLVCSNANHNQCVGVQTVTVGSYAPNAWGLYDMHGNVWEWCLDSYATYPSNPVVDPFVSDSQLYPYRLIRGGSLYDDPYYCRSAFRYGSYAPTNAGHNVGFRVVLGPVRNP